MTAMVKKSGELSSTQIARLAVARFFMGSALSGRANISAKLGKAFGGDRDYYEELGWPLDPEFDQYRGFFRRDGIGAKVIEMPADDSWRNPPDVIDGTEEDGERDTDFTKAVDTFAKRFRLWERLNRVDTLTGIGEYGVLLIGFSGESKLNEPIEGTLNESSVIYLKPLSQGQIKIREQVKEPSDPRFSLVESYTATLIEGMGSQEIHHSRCVHVVESPTTSEIEGSPRLERVINNLYDIMKVVGGSAEIFWEIMDRGMQFDIDEESKMDADAEDDLTDEIEAYYHRLQRFIRTRGVNVESLGAEQVSDPTGLFKILISIISAASDIPQRKLLGSERGELASSQDDLNWAAFIKSRQNNFVEPVILRPFFDKMITLGVFPKPKSGEYSFEFPNLFELNTLEMAEVKLKKAQTAQALSPMGQTDLLIPSSEARQEFLDLPPSANGEEPDRETELLDQEQSIDVEGTEG
jgi:phage-related protein (TIGR01555 family)